MVSLGLLSCLYLLWKSFTPPPYLLWGLFNNQHQCVISHWCFSHKPKTPPQWRKLTPLQTNLILSPPLFYTIYVVLSSASYTTQYTLIKHVLPPHPLIYTDINPSVYGSSWKISIECLEPIQPMTGVQFLMMGAQDRRDGVLFWVIGCQSQLRFGHCCTCLASCKAHPPAILLPTVCKWVHIFTQLLYLLFLLPMFIGALAPCPLLLKISMISIKNTSIFCFPS